jgi:hypothetical protein
VQLLTAEQALYKLVRRRTDHHRIRRRQALEAGGDVGRLTAGQVFVPVAATQRAHHHQPGMDAHAHGQADAAVASQAGVQGTEGLNNGETSVHGP